MFRKILQLILFSLLVHTVAPFFQSLLFQTYKWHNMQLFGCAYLGPFRHFLHLILDKIFKGKKDTSTVAKKVNWNLTICQSCKMSNSNKNITSYCKAYISSRYFSVQFFFFPGISKWSAKLLKIILFQVVLEQLTSSPWNNLMFMIYYGVVVEGKLIPHNIINFTFGRWNHWWCKWI